MSDARMRLTGEDVLNAVHPVGSAILFNGYVDDFGANIQAVQFSLDDGCTWTTYDVSDADPEFGVSWCFSYTPTRAGHYLLKARAVNGKGESSALVSGFAFDVQGAPAARGVATLVDTETLGDFNLRAVGGGPLSEARLFRSGELVSITPEQAHIMVHVLGIGSLYDIRTQWEVATHPQPYLMGAKTVALEPAPEARRKDASKRLVAGVIGHYGAPEERMRVNYRRYACEYPLIGKALRSIAAENASALVHCVNGKDRTGVLCAVAQKLAGVHPDDIMEDYLRTNELNAAQTSREEQELGAGMTVEEHAILLSFLEARPAYLAAFFDEIENLYGTFDNYVSQGLRLTPHQRESIAMMLGK